MTQNRLSIRWILISLLALAAVGVMIRLGFWQLDRLAQRRQANALVSAQVNAAPLDLNQTVPPTGDLMGMEYRPVEVRGEYDSSQEVLLRNQVHSDQLGYAVITPLKIEGSKLSVMVQRGWIPAEESTPELRVKYAELGKVVVKGIIRLPNALPPYGAPADPTLAPGPLRLDMWSSVNLGRIQQQVNLSLLPVYIQEAPDPTWSGIPYRSLSVPDLSEGPHMAYAIQWFLFSGVLAVGYPILLRRRLKTNPH
jgi:surfeit locus 1 family protein